MCINRSAVPKNSTAFRFHGLGFDEPLGGSYKLIFFIFLGSCEICKQSNNDVDESIYQSCCCVARQSRGHGKLEQSMAKGIHCWSSQEQMPN